MAVSVPNVPGVPSVIFAPVAGLLSSLLTADGPNLFRGSSLGQQWGIFRGGAPVVVADTVVGFDFRQQFAVSDYPVERGAFESYDKVYIPFDGRFRFTAGGSEANRAALLASIDAIIGDLNLYTIVTPEKVYFNVNLVHQDYSRTASSGVGMITVDVWGMEIRETASAALSNTADPGSASQVNGGPVQATPATPAQDSHAARLGL
jgi:hypothetical protein